MSLTFGMLGGGARCWSNRLEKLSQELGDIVGVVGVDGAVTQDGVSGLGDQVGAGTTWSTLLVPSLSAFPIDSQEPLQAAAAEAVYPGWWRQRPGSGYCRRLGDQ